jgi:hypothetical protein
MGTRQGILVTRQEQEGKKCSFTEFHRHLVHVR